MTSPNDPPRAGVAAPIPEGTLFLSNIATIWTGDKTLGELKDAGVLIRNNLIEWVGPMAEAPADAGSADTVLDLTGQLVTPGFINTHHHLFQSLTKAEVSSGELFEWLLTSYGIWQYLQPHQMYASAKATLAEMVLSGCTLSTDHAYTFPNGCLLEDLIRAARDVGIRFQPVRGAMSMGVSKGGMPPDHMVEEEDDIIADCKRCIEEFHDAEPHAMLRIALGPCAPFNVTKDLMVRSAKLARSYKHVRLHTHLAETDKDLEFSQRVFGQTPGEYIKSVGWDADDCWFAHCTDLSDEEVKLFAEKQCGLAHCPSSNCRLGSGIAPIRKCVDANVPVGLGLDGSSSNDGNNMVGEARLACLVSRVRDHRPPDDPQGVKPGDPSALSPRQVLEIATIGGARCLGRQTELGIIKPGFAADIVSWPASTALSFVGAQRDKVAGLILAAAWGITVSTSIINGRIVVKDGKFNTVDIAQVVEEVNRCSEEIYASVEEGKKKKEAAE